MDMNIDMSLLDLWKTLNDMNAGFLNLTLRNGNEDIVFSVVALTGEGTQEILDAINEIYDRQDKEAREIPSEN